MAVQMKNTDVVHALIFAGASVDLAENVRTVFNMPRWLHVNNIQKCLLAYRIGINFLLKYI